MAIATETKHKLTTEEYLALRPSPDATVKLDLVDGEVIEVSRPTFEHNELIANLIVLLVPFVHGRGLGRISFDILVILADDEDPLAPDLVYLSKDRLSLLREGRVWGVPELVVEVLSPNTASDEYGRKFLAYDRHAVPWLWIIDPEGRIEEYKHTDEGYLRTQTISRPRQPRYSLYDSLVPIVPRLNRNVGAALDVVERHGFLLGVEDCERARRAEM
jgi:Uma2 family endonuclease